MNDIAPMARGDLEFFPIQHAGKQLILIRDPLGLVQEGKAIGVSLYQIMALLDGKRTIRDLQLEFMRHQGGMLVGTDEIGRLLDDLNDSFLLDSEEFRNARDKIVADFASKGIRPCTHSGSGYPEDPVELRKMLDEILASQPLPSIPEGRITALVSPHIDFSVGCQVYSRAYQLLKHTAPSKVVLLGVGHQMREGLFCLTDKDFEPPLGVIKNDPSCIHRLREAGGDIITPNDFPHRSEHSIEFQLLFLQHLLGEASFTVIPILCGFIPSHVTEYSRNGYLEKADAFLGELRSILGESYKETLLLAGVDLSHIGPKFGDEMPARYLEGQSSTHDTNLLTHLARLEADRFWEESGRVMDRFHVCGFSALACLLETLPTSRGEVLDYRIWHEDATQSAVSFAAMVFYS
jgi:AmmeMemoRadiSam system protein B